MGACRCRLKKTPTCPLRQSAYLLHRTQSSCPTTFILAFLIFPSYVYNIYVKILSALGRNIVPRLQFSLSLFDNPFQFIAFIESSQKRFLSFFLYVPSPRNIPKLLRVISPPFYKFLKSSSCLFVSLSLSFTHVSNSSHRLSCQFM